MVTDAKVLVVEDNPDDVVLLQRAFSKAGADVRLDFVRDGQEALNYLKGVDHFAERERYPMPTLLLLDLKMPRIDGFGVIEWVRQQSQLEKLIIVVLSSSNERSDVTRAHELGANAYHVKPSDPNAWAGMLEGLRMYWVDRAAH